jgi:transcriptional regulator with XRE-family HTH domain
MVNDTEQIKSIIAVVHPELVLNTDSHFGKQLRSIRIIKKIKQTELAKRMRCHSTNVMHFEKGDNTFGNGSLTTVFKYARALGFNEIKFKL